MKTRELSTAVMFEDSDVRVLGTWDTPWFVAVDVLKALGIHEKNVSRVLKTLDDDEKGVVTVTTPGGDQDVLIVSEPGLYKILFRSTNPVAKRFTRWVTHEVLPSIHKYGYYDPRIEHTGKKGRPRLSSAEIDRREREKENLRKEKKRNAVIKKIEKKKAFVLANGEKLDINDLREYCRDLGASLDFVSGSKKKMIDFINEEMERRDIRFVSEIYSMVN